MVITMEMDPADIQVDHWPLEIWDRENTPRWVKEMDIATERCEKKTDFLREKVDL